MRGFWYAPHSSARQEAELVFKHDRYILTVGTNPPTTGAASTLDISDRVGNIPRKITFPEGALFETTANDTVDQWLEAIDHEDGRSHVLHILESRWRWIGVALIATLAIVWGTFQYGLPWMSEKIAYALPAKTNQWLADGAMETLDEALFEPSQLSAAKQAEIQQHFQTKLVPLQEGNQQYKLLFRYMPDVDINSLLEEIDLSEQDKTDSAEKPKKSKPPIKPNDPGIANAFALPSGEIVVTDGFINLVKSQDELDSVLLHEMGHVEYRHSLRQLIESSAISVGVLLVAGDVSALDSLLVGLPTFLLDSHYSRRHESESDQYAFEKMIKAKLDPIAFSHIMYRLENQNASDKDNEDKAPLTGLEKVGDYLSTHPNTVDRMENAKRYSEIYKKQLAQ